MQIPLAVLRGSSFLRFALVGGGCFLLNLGLLYGAKEKAHLHYLLASALSLLVVSGIGFFLNRRITFRVEGTQVWKELGRYYLVNTGSFALNLLLITLLVEGFKIYYLLANILVGVALMAANFWFHKSWSFGGSPNKKP